ncbi:hypothetical protein F5Y14DRAFT_455774 [Nemania sp. NC0429]|nr:hypothetical protein F5Y14DRAFT_455774 [Nemania sp. NC0429]
MASTSDSKTLVEREIQSSQSNSSDHSDHPNQSENEQSVKASEQASEAYNNYDSIEGHKPSRRHHCEQNEGTNTLRDTEAKEDRSHRTFTLFPRLPPELRLIIWKFALPSRRTLLVILKRNCGWCECPAIYVRHLDEDLSFPLAAVCQESRAFVKESGYRPWRYTTCSECENGSVSDFIGPWFCPEIDYIDERWVGKGDSLDGYYVDLENYDPFSFPDVYSVVEVEEEVEED